MATHIIGWKHNTNWGTFRILRRGARFVAMFEDDDLGSYPTAVAALDDLCGGHTFSLPGNLDSATMNLPDSLGDWTPIEVRK